MTWNGTIPGPVISVDQCDKLEITVRNDDTIIHSIDFHAGYGPSNAVSGNILAGNSKTFNLTADIPGVFMYHCTGDALYYHSIETNIFFRVAAINYFYS